jgi:hypothetical protein
VAAAFLRHVLLEGTVMAILCSEDLRPAIEPIWVRPKRAAQIGGFGLTRCYELINDGQLKTTKVGGMRLVSVASIKALGVVE